MRFHYIAPIGMFTFLLWSNVSLAQDFARPKPGGPLRYDEDWSFLSNTEYLEGQSWERFKYIPLNDNEYPFVTFGAELRARYEFLGNPNWGEEETDSGGYFWFRFLPIADLNLSDELRLFTELIVAPSVGVDPKPSGLDDDVGDFLQLFAEMDIGDSMTLIAGRSVLSIGSERLVGTRYGVNVLQSFDIAKISLGNESNNIFALYGRPVDVEVGSFNDDWSRNRQGWTLYYTRDLLDTHVDAGVNSFLDLYYMGFENTLATFDQGTGLEQRHTFAGRLHGSTERWGWDCELFVQVGNFAETEIQAWSLATLIRYAPKVTQLEPVFSLQFNTISGDRNRNDSKLGTFNAMFPKLKYFGETGVISPANLFDLHPAVSIGLAEGVRLKADVQFLWRYSVDDGVYGAGGRLLRSGAGSDARYVSTQYELGAEIESGENLTCNAFYAVITPGRFIQDTGASEVIHFVGLETTLSY